MDPQELLAQATRRPNIEIISSLPHALTFKLSNSDTSFANALRRVILVETPTLAIEVVKILENTTVFHDQYLAHRLGLIPIHSATVHQFNNPRECVCVDYCEHCSVDYTLKVHNPPHALSNMEVTSRDLVPISFEFNIDDQDYERFPPVPLGFQNCEKQKAVLICQLKPGQTIHMLCKARKGIGKEHAKWQPCATVSMQVEPVVEVNRLLTTKLSGEERRAIIASCPRKVFRQQNSIHGDFIDVEDAWKCIQCKECTAKAANMSEEGFLRVGINDTSFKFTVESSGSLVPYQIVEFAIKSLNDKLKGLAEHLQNTSFDGFV